ncbi:MAG: carbohydrate kinase family protein [Candidatus Heimdallarchaeota archaeon]
MKSPDVIAIGEVLIDFVSSKSSKGQLPSFQQCPGGAPANFIVGMARLGVNTAFIGKVSNDPFGEFLINTLNNEGVQTTNVLKAVRGEKTALAFVFHDENNERDFLFYRENSADQNLFTEEIKEDLFKNIKFLHFGSVSLTEEPLRSATFAAIDMCKKNGGKISFDPNIRLDLWEFNELDFNVLKKALEKTDVFLPSFEELAYFTDQKKMSDQQIIDELFGKYNLEIIVVKKGKDGCLIKQKNGFFAEIPSFDVPVKDTTGAGDGFNAGFLYGLLNDNTIEEAGIIGNAVGAFVIQREGAMTALPTYEELGSFLAEQKITLDLKID